MQFDPAIAAQLSFKRAQALGELGRDLAQAREAEEIFSASAGSEAKAAYFILQEIGTRWPEAISFQESVRPVVALRHRVARPPLSASIWEQQMACIMSAP